MNTRRSEARGRGAAGAPLRALNLRGFGAFTRKEFLETRKTWRLWVVPGVLVFLGLTTPVLAAVTPTLLKMTAERQPGVVIRFPAPTSLDAYTQFIPFRDKSSNFRGFVIEGVAN